MEQLAGICGADKQIIGGVNEQEFDGAVVERDTQDIFM